MVLAWFLGAALGAGGTYWWQSCHEIRAEAPEVEKAAADRIYLLNQILPEQEWSLRY